jgi:putative nucleotidyltransferase with HDIG domain
VQLTTLAMLRGLRAHLDRWDELQVFPTAAARVLQVARHPTSTMAQMEEAVCTDSVLAGRLLKLANSPFYARRTRIDSVGRAIAVLGFSGTRDVALALAIGAVGSDKSPWGQSLWCHALSAAWACRLMGRHVRQVDVEAAFLMGLLHDVGLQLLLVLRESEMNQLLDTHGMEPSVLLQAERELLGTDHAELGAACLRRWSLPDAVTDAVAYHHQPIGAVGMARPRDVALLQVADAFADAMLTADGPDALAAHAYAQPGAAVLRAVRGAYERVAIDLWAHRDHLGEL